MLTSGVLDVAIGLAFIYLLLSLLCTALNEWFATVTKLRAKTLEEGIGRMFSSLPNGGAVTQAFWNHPLIQSQSREGEKPSYLSSGVFATALHDVVNAEPKFRQAGSLVESLTRGVENVQEEKQRLENWFNDSMDRVSGWYRRNTQWKVFLIAAVITIFMNADTIEIANRLWTNPALRSAIVEQARMRAAQPAPLRVEYPDPESPYPTVPTVQSLSEAAGLTADEQKSLSDLVGWEKDRKTWSQKSTWAWFGDVFYNHAFGWLATMIAISMGAPFWFDMLNRLIKIRGSGPAPDAKKDKTKEPANANT